MKTFEPDKGVNIYAAAKEAVSKARAEGAEVALKFNGILMYVSPFSHFDDIVTIYNLECELRRLQS